MTTSPWLLPEGIEEVLPPRAADLEMLRRRIIDLYTSWGYELVIPPLIEFLGSLLTGTGHDLDLQTFKVTDQLSGRLMGVRADMTPQVARIDAHRLQRDVPVRLCYLGVVLRTRPDGSAGSRSPLQIGAELYGHGGIESDVEILSLMLETLAVAGVDEVHVDLGHVGVFRGLARQAGLDPQQEQRLFDALQRKAASEIDAALEELAVDAEVQRMLAALVNLNGAVEVLDQAERVLSAAPADVHTALHQLRTVSRVMAARMPGVPMYFDLAELRGYNFHTGLVFAAFVPGEGQEVARGGRYDDIGAVFGRARPATGFSTDLKILARLSGNVSGSRPPAILAPWSDDQSLVDAMRKLRREGEIVVQALPGHEPHGSATACNRRLVRSGETWDVEPL